MKSYNGMVCGINPLMNQSLYKNIVVRAHLPTYQTVPSTKVRTYCACSYFSVSGSSSDLLYQLVVSGLAVAMCVIHSLCR